ncbi:MAG: UDP-N-acetylmuramoyl-L-alanine--D-glutamate ligase [Actinomycetota bacterium]
MTPSRPHQASWLDASAYDIPWRQLRVLVCGSGVTGSAAAAFLRGRGASVEVVDAPADAPPPPVGRPDLVIASPGWSPRHPLLTDLLAAGVPIWSEVELAWHATTSGTQWLAVTGTNGKTTTTEMLLSMLLAEGLVAAAAGNIGTPLIDVVSAPDPPQWVAVEVSSFQLHWPHTLRPRAAAVLNVAPDHLDWHGSLESYAHDKGSVFGPGTRAVFNIDDPWSVRLAAVSPDRVGFTTGHPTADGYGVAVGDLVAPGFARICAGAELGVAGEHNVANALAAAALAAVAGVRPEVAGRALMDFRAGEHRLTEVAVVCRVRFVDDSKATNPHAAARALATYRPVVWIAGGLNKGLDFDDLVAGARDRLSAVVLIGACAGEIEEALRRHAPDIPVRRARSMHTAVKAAASLARPGETVLLAPAAASMDMFRDYRDRGEQFVAAVRELERETEPQP